MSTTSSGRTTVRRYTLLLLALSAVVIPILLGGSYNRGRIAAGNVDTTAFVGNCAGATTLQQCLDMFDVASLGGGGDCDYTATDTTELVAAVAAAVTGEIVCIEDGTYTLTNATGTLVTYEGITLRGTGKDRVTITQDGTLADRLILASIPASKGTYGVANKNAWLYEITFDVAADALNVEEGDTIYINASDPWPGDKYRLAATAIADGAAGKAYVDTRWSRSYGGSTSVIVGTPVRGLRLEGFTLDATPGAATTEAMNLSWQKNFRVEDVRIIGPATGWCAVISAGIDGKVDLELNDCDLGFYGAVNTASKFRVLNTGNACNGGGTSNTLFGHNYSTYEHITPYAEETGCTFDLLVQASWTSIVETRSASDATWCILFDGSGDIINLCTCRKGLSGGGYVGECT